MCLLQHFFYQFCFPIFPISMVLKVLEYWVCFWKLWLYFHIFDAAYSFPFDDFTILSYFSKRNPLSRILCSSKFWQSSIYACWVRNFEMWNIVEFIKLLETRLMRKWFPNQIQHREKCKKGLLTKYSLVI